MARFYVHLITLNIKFLQKLMDNFSERMCRLKMLVDSMRGWSCEMEGLSYKAGANTVSWRERREGGKFCQRERKFFA